MAQQIRIRPISTSRALGHSPSLGPSSLSRARTYWWGPRCSRSFRCVWAVVPPHQLVGPPAPVSVPFCSTLAHGRDVVASGPRVEGSPPTL